MCAIHVELIFVYDVEWESSIIIFHMDTQLSVMTDSPFPVALLYLLHQAFVYMCVNFFLGISGTLICLLLHQSRIVLIIVTLQ